MQIVTKEHIEDCLTRLGIQTGDGLLVHSAVQFLGHPEGGLGIYLDAIQNAIGKSGTVVVPTFNFSFAAGEPYDPAHTPSKGMGVFSEFIRLQPGAMRSQHPMQSIAAIGHYASDLTSRDTLSAFDPGSAFERMLELDFKILLLGADARAISMFHYCEQRANVPYRYWKDFTGEVHTSTGRQTRTYRMYVRDLEIKPELTLEPVVDYMTAHQEWESMPLNYGRITTCRLRDFTHAAEVFLRENPWSLVTNVRVGTDGVIQRLPIEE